MADLPEGCADLIIADPPYNLSKDFGQWNEVKKREEWLPWSKKWLFQAKRIMRPGANIFLYGIHHHLCWLQCFMYELGLSYRRQIIWNYENGFAGYTSRTLAAHYEPLLWFSNGDSYTYNPIREPYKSKERLKYKITKGKKVWKPNPEGRLAGDVWKFPTLAGRRFKDEKVPHPTQKPLSITRRIVKHFSNEGDLVVVPFAGSGSECQAAAMENRRYIGFEINPTYIKMAEKRIRQFNRQQGLTFRSETDPDNLQRKP
jgi:site-specific DNA-methyltransferase (adenine-specific)/adenine-specific DNA-methyltransferase